MTKIEQILNSCDFVKGQDVKEFEQELAEYLGVAEVVSCACATDGLFASLKMLEIGPGDEVIAPAMTAFPTAEAIAWTGAQIVLADIDPLTCTIDPDDVQKKITSKTKAIVVVHLYGHPADLDKIIELSRQHEILVVEDCAQALGAEYRGQKVGTIEAVGVFSFFPSKPLGGFGDGGAVIAQDQEILKRIRMFCNHGRISKFAHELMGINSRLDTLQAALLRVVLPYLDEWNEARLQGASFYQRNLPAHPIMDVPQLSETHKSAWHIFAIRVPQRDELASYLRERGVQTNIHYPFALNEVPALQFLNQDLGSFPVAEHHGHHTLSLPLFPTISTSELEWVCAATQDFIDSCRKE